MKLHAILLPEQNGSDSWPWGSSAFARTQLQDHDAEVDRFRISGAAKGGKVAATELGDEIVTAGLIMRTSAG